MTELGHNYSLCLAKDVYEAANSRKMTEFGTPCALANDVNIDSNGTNIQLTLVFGVRLTLLWFDDHISPQWVNEQNFPLRKL
jgi:hypothetical protein